MKKLISIAVALTIIIGIFTTVTQAAQSGTGTKIYSLKDYMKSNYSKQYVVAFVVNRPVPNSRLVSTNDLSNSGHAYLMIKNANDVFGSFSIGANAIGGGSSTNDQTKATTESLIRVLIKKDVPFRWMINDTQWSIATFYVLNKQNFDKLMKYVSLSPAAYNIETGNCTVYSLNGLTAAGITKLPTQKHYWQLPTITKSIRDGLNQFTQWYTLTLSDNEKKTLKSLLDGTLNYYGYNPADATQDIKSCGKVYITNGWDGNGLNGSHESGAEVIEYNP